MGSLRATKSLMGKVLTYPPLNLGVRYVAGPVLRLLPTEKRPLLPVRGAVVIPFEFQGREYQMQWVSAGRDGIMTRLYWRGARSSEGDTISFFMELASRSKVFLDVGANTGLFTLFGKTVNPDLRIIAIEPVPAILDALQTNIAANRFENVSVLGTALSDQTCLLDFFINATPFSLPTSASIKEGFQSRISQTMHVHALTLDQLNTELLDGECDLAKIDVEGAEFSVLEGSQETLSSGKMMIICEILEPEALSRMASFLEQFDYRIFGLVDGVLAPVNVEATKESFRENNYFLVPPAWRESLEACQLLRLA